MHQGLLISLPIREYMDELSLAETWRQRWEAKQLGISLDGSKCKDVSADALVSATIDAWTGDTGRRVVDKFTKLLLAPADAALWKPWDSARTHATFDSTAELVLITMADAWRRLVFARDRQPYLALWRHRHRTRFVRVRVSLHHSLTHWRLFSSVAAQGWRRTICK